MNQPSDVVRPKTPNIQADARQTAEVLEWVDAHQEDALARLFELLRIDSVSTDPAHAEACRRAADWLAEDLSSFEFDATVHETTGHPIVTGRHASGPGQRPHVMFYGHYDVQPVDPLELWHRDPFDPAIEDTDSGQVIRARGAADDKGQLMTFVEACRAWKSVTGSLPLDVTLFFEGEEESGSPSLLPFMRQQANLLKADLALVCDTGMWDPDTPTISTMLRGMVGEQITIHGPSHDLHSGMYGGPAINPIRVLNRILSDLHDDDGRITLAGFYDGVTEIPAELRQQWQQLGQNESAFLGAVGLSQAAGEPSYSVLEQIWARPTCDVNGIVGGYTGPGFKTVLPAKASAKISFRLVGDQDPDKIRDALHRHVAVRLPADCRVEYDTKEGSRATVMPIDAPAFLSAREALSEEWPNEAVFAGCGGSIPVVGHIQRVLDMDSLLIGFMLDDDAIHSPNEKYSLRSFHKGTRSWVRVLGALAGLDRSAT